MTDTDSTGRPPAGPCALIADTPITVQLLYPERTRGGVYGDLNEIAIDLSLGIELKRRRRALGDGLAGASAAGTPRYLARTTNRLGLRWPTGQGGPASSARMGQRLTG